MCSVTQSCPSLCDPMGCKSTRLLCPGILQNTEVGCHFLFQGIFPTQGLNPYLLHWQAGSFTTELLGKLQLDGSLYYGKSLPHYCQYPAMLTRVGSRLQTHKAMLSQGPAGGLNWSCVPCQVLKEHLISVFLSKVALTRRRAT